MAPRRAGHHLMRNINRSIILRHLRTAAGLSRADLAGRTGLMRSTVSSLVDDLLAESLIREVGAAPSRGGRRGTLLDLNPAGGCAIGVEITSQAVLVLLTDFIAQPCWQQAFTLSNKDPEVIIPQTEHLIEDALQFNAQNDAMKLYGIGLGIAGLVDTQHGTLKVSSNLGWRNIPFKKRWEQRFRLPVHVSNEATIAAQGEHFFGAAADCTDFIYLHLSTTAIGAGVFVDGRLYQGVTGFAGEIGHTVVDPAGELCTCGKRGCWEAQLEAACDVGHIRQQLEAGAESLIHELERGYLDAITFQTVLTAATQGDAFALTCVSRMNTVLATGIANLINIFNPQLVVLGGSLGIALAPFLPAIRSLTADQVIAPADGMADIEVSQIESNASAMGAVALVLDDILRQPVC